MNGRPPLRTIYAYLTSGCNCACRHCWIVSSGRQGAGRLLDIEVFRQAIDQARPLGLRSIKWTGGEPTLHPRFGEFLGLQSAYGLTGVVETNGMLMTRELAERMRETGVDSVSVSLDGANAAVHDAIRGTPGGFDRTVAGIEALAASGYSPELILTLQRRNADRLPDYLRLARELGAGNVKLNVVQPLLQGRRLEAQGETLTIDELLKIAAGLRASDDLPDGLPVNLDLPPAFRPLGKIANGADSGFCDILHILGLIPEGKYALCGIGQHVEELVMGDVLSAPLAGIWEGHPVLNTLRDGLPGRLKGVCGQCLMSSVCRGNCIAANYHGSRDLFAPFWFCQRAYEQGLFPAFRLRAGAEGNRLA